MPATNKFIERQITKYFVLGLCLVYSLALRSQQYNISSNNGVLGVEKLYATKDNGIMLCGTTSEYQNKNSLFISKLDKDFNQIWTNVYFDLNAELHYTGIDDTVITNVPFITFIIPTADEKQFIIGGSYDSSSVITITGGPTLYSLVYQKAFLLKIDDTGNKLWCKKYEIEDTDPNNYSTNSFTAAAINPFNENEIFVAGYHNRNGYHDISVLKLNSSGNVLKQTGFGSPLDEGISQIAVSPEKKLILIGTTDSDSRNIFYSEAEIDNLSVLLSIFLKAGPLDFSRDLKVFPDNSKLILAHTGTGVQSFISLIKLNPDNSIAWSKKIGNNSLDVAYNMEIDNSGHIIIGGLWVDPVLSKDFDYLFIECHSNGKILFSGKYGYQQLLNSKEHFTDIKVSKNSIYLAGNSDSGSLSQNKSYLVKVNSIFGLGDDCNFQPLDYFSTDISINKTTASFNSYSPSVYTFVPLLTVIKTSEKIQRICIPGGGGVTDDIIIYPVPFQGSLFIHSGPYLLSDLSFTLYDAIGRRLISKKLISDQLLGNNQLLLSSGYYVVVIAKGNEILKKVGVVKLGR